MDAIQPCHRNRRRDELIRLTQDLIRIPTLNPPGRHYRDICDYLGAQPPQVGLAMPAGPRPWHPGDSAIPRWNMIASHDAAAPANACISTAITTSSRSATAGAAILSAGAGGRPHLWPRRACDMKGGWHQHHRRRALRRAISRPSRPASRSAPPPTRIGRLRRRGLSGRPGAFAHVGHVIIPNRCTGTASALAIAASGGPRSGPMAASPTARCRFWRQRHPPHGRRA